MTPAFEWRRSQPCSPNRRSSRRHVPRVELSAREGYAAWAATYDEGANPLITLEEPAVAELLAGAVPGRALDAACGTGRHIPLLVALGHNVVGVDASPEMLALARRRSSEAELRQADLEALPLASGSFDVAVCALALGHVSELGPTVAELARVLRRGGRLVVSVIHPLLSALGGEALFTQPDGGPAFVREAPICTPTTSPRSRRTGSRCDGAWSRHGPSPWLP